jgi:hypothetical protein
MVRHGAPAPVSTPAGVPGQYAFFNHASHIKRILYASLHAGLCARGRLASVPNKEQAMITTNDIRIKSTWPTPIGKPLTNHRITYYIMAGWYGDSMKERHMSRVKRDKKARLVRALAIEY